MRGAKTQKKGPVPGWTGSQDADPSPAQSYSRTRKHPFFPEHIKAAEDHCCPLDYFWRGLPELLSRSAFQAPGILLPTSHGQASERRAGESSCCWAAELPRSLGYQVPSHMTPRDRARPVSISGTLSFCIIPLLSTLSLDQALELASEEGSHGEPHCPTDCGPEGLCSNHNHVGALS